jgi:NAD-dependent SIR2 family protein deacetylase
MPGTGSQVRVITQNIDTLHQQTRTHWSAVDQLIEVHGRLGLYHCASDEDNCDLATETSATAAHLFSEPIRQAIEVGPSPWPPARRWQAGPRAARW